MTSIAFLGLGVMGSGMAARLLGAGFAVTVWNRGAGRADRLREQGAAVASSPREAASAADVGMIADSGSAQSTAAGPSSAVTAVMDAHAQAAALLSGARPAANQTKRTDDGERKIGRAF